MPLIKENETFPERPILVVIAGTPFSYKTSMAITAHKPILFDAEAGAERAKGRVPTFRITAGWGEVEAEVENGLLADFSTVAVDTAKAMLDDHMWEYALSKNFTKNKQKTFGDVADVFKKFVSRCRNAGKDIVIISHEKSKDEDDARVYDLDITGSSKQLLLRMADQVGFAYKDQVKTPNGVITQTIITFNPKKEWPFCKNVAGLPDIIIPHFTKPEWDGFLDKVVIQPTKKAISAMSEEQIKTLEVIAEWQASISATTPDEDPNFSNTLLELNKSMGGIAEQHIKIQVLNFFRNHLKSIGWVWDKDVKAFVVVKKPAEATPAGNEPATPPAVEQPKPPVQQNDEPPAQNVAGTPSLVPPATLPSINDGAQEQNDNGLFDPKE